MFRSVPWKTRRYTEYRIFRSGEETDHTPLVNFLLQTNATGHADEGFRFSVEGPTLEADIWAKDILEVTSLRHIRFRLDTRAADLEFRANSFSSKWEDVEDLLAHVQLIAFQEDSQTDKSPDVRKALETGRNIDGDLGASLRWSLQTNGPEELKIVLQCLPRPASKLRRDSRLAADECPAIHLASWKVKTTFENSGPCLGPRPIIFARAPEEVDAVLQDHPTNLQTGMCCIFSRWLNVLFLCT